ncbi:MAG: hypothetical protein N3A00_05030, partial [Thermodesulfovibrio sp.]|nr:hypothetical protein [Thermodesulfovibrio sp.]
CIRDRKKEIKQILLDIQDMLNNLQLLVSQRQEHIMEQLPKDIEKGSLHKVLGYEEDFNLAD